MTKVAKLVCISLMTRVVVDEDADELETMKVVKDRILAKIQNDELLDNLEFIEDDTECPFGSLPSDQEHM